MKQIVEEIEKKMSRSRNRKMESSMNEMERIMVNTSYRELEDILNETIKDKKY